MGLGGTVWQCLCLVSYSQIVDGVSYLHAKKNGLHFAFTTKFNVSPCLSLELLERITKVFKVSVCVCVVLTCAYVCD